MLPKIRVLIALLVVVLIATGCKGADPLITMSFDGEECIHDGPETMKAGEVTLIFDPGEIEGKSVEHWFRKLDQGATWDEYIAVFPNDGAGGQLGADVTGPPPWLKFVSAKVGETPGEYVYKVEPGEYVTLCMVQSPTSIYPGGLLIVE